MSTCTRDAKKLIPLHWDEVALNKDKIHLNPDWDVYESLEKDGKFKIFTARDDTKLVGYFAVIVSTNPHYKDHISAFGLSFP